VTTAVVDTGAGSSAEQIWQNLEQAPGDDRIRLKSVRVVNASGKPAPEIDIREPVFVEVDYWNLSEDPGFRPYANLHFFTADGTYLFTVTTTTWAGG
jgi:lipopolysaccharide transport system ATP-binding protein